jgi:hypothetical protein
VRRPIPDKTPRFVASLIGLLFIVLYPVSNIPFDFAVEKLV